MISVIILIIILACTCSLSLYENMQHKNKIKVLEQNFDTLETEIVDFKTEVLEYMKKVNKDTATYIDTSMRILKLTDELHRHQEEQRVEIARIKIKMEENNEE